MVALVGDNGSGKSTLLAVLGGQLSADAGMVWLDGRRINDLDASIRAQLGLSRMFQDSRLWPEMSVGEHFAVMQDTRRSPKTGLAALSLALGIKQSMLDRLPEELTLLDRRRIELCLALYGARFILCDELGAGLSIEEATSLYLVIRHALAQQWITAALMVEHRHALLEKYCTEFKHLERGRLL
jgi:ABC-type branched-subunit amino acid transport system ATPase component